MEYVGVFLATNVCLRECVLCTSVNAVFKLVLIVFLILLKCAQILKYPDSSTVTTYVTLTQKAWLKKAAM